MKRLALVAAVLTIAACTTKKDEGAAATDTAAPAMAPAPATTADTSMKMDTSMKHDSAAMSKDTAKKM
jgi:hypothetical protein